MKTSLEQLEPTKVKLIVEVEPERVSEAFDEAARHLAQNVQIRGFRKGKAPRRLIEAHLGKGAVAAHALEDQLSEFYSEAVRREDLRPVAPPQIDVQRFTEEEGCAFEATVEVVPEFDLPDHEGIEVLFPEWDVTDQDVQRQLDDMRERFAELEEVDRPAAVGDYVTIDLSATRDGEPIEAATAQDALYEVGSGGVTPRLDEELAGAVPGQTLTYTDRLPDEYPVHPGEEVEFTVVVNDVREKRLPALDDEFAETASEFDTLEELQDEIRHSLRRRRLAHARQELRARVLEAYLARVEVPVPEAMVESEVEARLGQMQRQAEQYGLDLEQLAEIQGTDLASTRRQLEEQARQTAKAQLVLDRLAVASGVDVSSGDVEDEIVRHAREQRVDPRELAEVVSRQGHLGVLVGDVVRRKALDRLVAAAQVEGAPSEEVLEELGFGEPDTAAGSAPAHPGEGTSPHPPDLGAEEPPAAVAAEPDAPESDTGA